MRQIAGYIFVRVYRKEIINAIGAQLESNASVQSIPNGNTKSKWAQKLEEMQKMQAERGNSSMRSVGEAISDMEKKSRQ